ncbi:MAG: hypothetical protein V1729_03975 [Candidatus Woesearchaeota archaeon]
MKNDNTTDYIIEIDESMREIAALDELYTELVGSSPESDREMKIKQDEAKFARDRILRLSMHIKNRLAKIESHEKLK